mmetsp:Transcript_83208/g.139061  ORF Transcript_83208/g.139061 Transcript_83208/m.139061 type:complete len:119 (-) Transcript_83208:767-1123(-)
MGVGDATAAEVVLWRIGDSQSFECPGVLDSAVFLGNSVGHDQKVKQHFETFGGTQHDFAVAHGRCIRSRHKSAQWLRYCLGARSESSGSDRTQCCTGGNGMEASSEPAQAPFAFKTLT